jgi:hypothetical protein
MPLDQFQVPKLIYAPAKRGASNTLLMIAGTYGTGKTYSALRLATGLAEGGEIDFADTENGRALYYADKFKFNHCPIHPPFRPEVFEAAAVLAQSRGSRVWVCDNFSWEHVGPGGLLEWHEKEVMRLSRGDVGKFDQVKATAWIAPKEAHRNMLQRLWQLNMHIVICVQAKKKLLISKDPKTGKTKWSDGGWAPVCGEDIPYAMTSSLLLQPDMGLGIPVILKHQDDLDPLIPEDQPISEEIGRAIAAWARGEKAEPVARAPKPPTSTAELRGEAKNLAVANELVAAFKAVKVRAEHFALVDNEDTRKRIDWFKLRRPALYERITDAMAESWGRTEPPRDSTEPPTEDSSSTPPEDDPDVTLEDYGDAPTEDGPPPSDFPGDPGYRPSPTLTKQEALL